MENYSLSQKIAAELIGTFVLTFFGCGTAIVTNCSTDNYPGYLLTALAFGLSIVAMAYSIGSISGCHINPAVSLAKLIRGDLSIKEFISYVIAQCAGGVLAGAFLLLLFGKESGLGSNGLYKGNNLLSFVIEIILTCVFILSVLGVTEKEENGLVAGLVIGGALSFVHILGIGLTGTSVNPARSLVAIFAGGDALRSLWVFLAAPLVGSILAVCIWGLLSKRKYEGSGSVKDDEGDFI